MRRRRNKEQTIEMLIGAVGELLLEKGHQAIGVNKIAAAAGVSKPMIYTYFGGLNGLLLAYMERKGFGLQQFEAMDLSGNLADGALKAAIINHLQGLFHHARHDPEVQKLILWQVAGYNPVLRKAAVRREAAIARLFEIAEHHFKDSGAGLRMVYALLAGGLYYHILLNAAGNGTLSGIDLSNEAGCKLLNNTIVWLIELAWRDGATISNSSPG
ncbi:MAG: TetR/AcrR family transcriptional regulator [Bacteroidota bacterium]|nr:TetR/AcrR family transcriptional regulator [Bacteroidota bacterium]